MIEAIGKGLLNPIRRMPVDEFKISATAAIAALSEAYSGADIMKESNRAVYTECARLLRRQFPGLAIAEIHEAFALAAAQKIDADLTAYKGVFTVAMFGAVLTAYVDFRKKIVAELSKTDSDLQLQAVEDEKRERFAMYRQHVIDEFARLKLKNNQIASAENIPLSWAKILTEELLITSDAEAWKAAKIAVCEDFITKTGQREEDITIGSLRACQRISERLREEPDYFPEELHQRAVNLYGRTIVFRELAKFEFTD